MPRTETTREDYGRKEIPYASDSADEETTIVSPFMPTPSKVPGPRTAQMRIF